MLSSPNVSRMDLWRRAVSRGKSRPARPRTSISAGARCHLLSVALKPLPSESSADEMQQTTKGIIERVVRGRNRSSSEAGPCFDHLDKLSASP
jgi:hypothetical protein